MKKIIFLISAVLYSLASVGQQVALNNEVSINIPKEAKKITKEEALAHAGRRFNSDKYVLKSINDRTTRYTYKVNDILVSLTVFDHMAKVKEGFLSENKKGLDAMNSSNKTYTSSLQKINNNSVLIMNYIAGEVEYYRFVCYSPDNSKEMTGVLEFDKIDKNEATSILNHLLNSIKFKD